jgi:opacity protein-like surface antigen
MKPRTFPRRIIFIMASLAWISITFASPAAHAQTRYPSRYASDSPKFTFSLFVGSRFGGRIDINTPNVDYLPISSSLNEGFNFGVGILPNLYAETMWNRQTTTLSAHDAATNATRTLTNKAHLDMYQESLLYEIPLGFRSHLRPFVVAGFGFTHFDSHGVLSFSNRLSYNFGGGVKYIVVPQVAFRAELRYSPSRTTSSNVVFCDPFLGCFTTPVSNHAEQGQANIGVEFRF